MLLPYFEAVEASWLAKFVLSSTWIFPAIEAVHLLGLSLLGGAILIVDLRLINVGMKGQSVERLARDARPWLITAIVMLILTGVPLFSSEAVKCYYNQSFWIKITTLPFAIAFAFTVRERVTRNAVHNTARRQKLVGALSIALWFTVAAAGRWIGFS